MPDNEAPSGNSRPESDATIKAPRESGGHQQPPRNLFDSQSDPHQENPSEIERDIRKGESWLIGIGIASVFVNLLIAWIYLGQLQQMRKATEGTTAALKLAQDSATTENSHFDRTMRQVISQTAATEQAAIESKNQADIADETLRKSQRPWVNAESFAATMLTLPPAGKFYVAGDVVIKNAGTSVATDGWVMVIAAPNSTKWLTKHWDQACQIDDRQRSISRASAAKGVGDTWPIGFVLAPNQQTRMRMGAGDADGLIDTQIKRAIQLKNAMPWMAPGQDPKSGQFYLLGCARYKDQFGTQHTTRFCFIYLNDKMSPSGFYTCNGMESAN